MKGNSILLALALTAGLMAPAQAARVVGDPSRFNTPPSGGTGVFDSVAFISAPAG